MSLPTRPRHSVDRFRRDLSLALRALRRTPGFTAAAIAILGLGIGMSSAMFTIYRTVLVEQLPVADQDRLIIMHPLDRRRDRLRELHLRFSIPPQLRSR